MSEIFEGLAVIGDAVSEEDRVVHLLASLPESYNVLVTALEAQSENIPKWELVTERLLHQESKLKEKVTMPLEGGRKALNAGQNKGLSGTWIIDSGATCHMCNNKKVFIDMRHLDTPQQVTLGDGSSLEGPAEATVKLDMILRT